MNIRDSFVHFPNAAANAFLLLLKVNKNEKDTILSVLVFLQCVPYNTVGGQSQTFHTVQHKYPVVQWLRTSTALSPLSWLGVEFSYLRS